MSQRFRPPPAKITANEVTTRHKQRFRSSEAGLSCAHERGLCIGGFEI